MSFPPVEELLPHAGPMVLLERVLAHDSASTTCAAASRSLVWFADAGGGVPAALAIEWMAQCIAVHGGLLARAEGRPPQVGFLLGSRRLELGVGALPAEGRYRVRAERVWGQERGLVAFQCGVREEGAETDLVSGRLNAFLPDDLEEILKGEVS